jgi:RecB family exonuclease
MPRGLVRAITDAVKWITAELVERDASVADLSALIQPESEATAANLAEIVTSYRGLLKRHALADAYVRVGGLIETWKRHGFSEPYAYLVLSEFASLNAVERAAFDALLPSFEQTIVTLAIPDVGEEAIESHRAFVGIRLMTEFFERYSPETIVANASNERSVPSEVARRLFQRHVSSLPVPNAGDCAFRVLRCANRREEVRTVARLIRQRVGRSSLSADFTRFTVVVPMWEPYQGLIEETFREYGLPTTVSRGIPLSEIPALRRIAKALGAMTPHSEGWTLETLLDVFESASFGVPEQASLEDRISRLLRRPVDLSGRRLEFDARRFDASFREAGITGPFDADGWFDRVALYQAHVAGYDESAPVTFTDDERRKQFESRIVEFAFDIAVLEHAVNAFGRVFTMSSPEPCADELSRLCTAFGIIRQAQPPKSPDAPEYREYSGWHAFKDAMNEMLETFQLITDVTGRGFDGTAFAEALAQAISDSDLQCFPPQCENGVRVIQTTQAVGESYEHLFIVGLVEGEFPRMRAANVYIAPDESRSRNPSVIALDPLPSERFRFREMLMNADSVTITYPTLETSKSLIRSPFVDDVLDVYGESESDEIAPQTDEERMPILSVREALVAMGQLTNADGSETLELPCANVAALIRTETLRSRLDAWSPYDGYLSPTPEIRAVLEAYSAKPYTVSELEAYARCPIRHFFGYLLGLRADDVFREDVSPNVRGQIVHEVLERFYRNLSANLGDDGIDRRVANRRMLAIAKETLRRYDALYPNLYWEEERHLLLRGLDNQDDEPGLLAAFLNVEFSPTVYSVTGQFTRSLYSELRIGKEPEPLGGTSASPSLTRRRRDGSGELAIEGRIDRVDVELKTGRYVVFDYKTGAIPSLTWTKNGYLFQLPIYLLALRGYDGVCGDGVASAFYNMRRPSDVGVKDALYVAEEASEANRNRTGRLSRDAFDAFLARTEERLSEIDDAIRNGRFHWTLADETIAGCRFCPYRDICRMNPSRRYAFVPTQPHYDPGVHEVNA